MRRPTLVVLSAILTAALQSAAIAQDSNVRIFGNVAVEPSLDGGSYLLQVQLQSIESELNFSGNHLTVQCASGKRIVELIVNTNAVSWPYNRRVLVQLWHDDLPRSSFDLIGFPGGLATWQLLEWERDVALGATYHHFITAKTTIGFSVSGYDVVFPADTLASARAAISHPCP